VSRSLFSGKPERWAPATASSIVLVVSSMVGWVGSLDVRLETPISRSEFTSFNGRSLIGMHETIRYHIQTRYRAEAILLDYRRRSSGLPAAMLENARRVVRELFLLEQFLQIANNVRSATGILTTQSYTRRSPGWQNGAVSFIYLVLQPLHMVCDYTCPPTVARALLFS
jgi:hypothetical protein